MADPTYSRHRGVRPIIPAPIQVVVATSVGAIAWDVSRETEPLRIVYWIGDSEFSQARGRTGERLPMRSGLGREDTVV